MRPICEFLDYSGREDRLAGGVRMLPVRTPAGTFKVWTKRIGNNPDLRVLLLHGGPGATHEYLEACDGYLPSAGIEYYYYDQLGSAFSDQPDAASLWDLGRFVDEVEQVRQALGLTPENFVLYGQSWGGILAMEYALAHPHALKGLVISNMMADVPAYNAYAQDVLKPAMDQDALREIEALESSGDIENPRYICNCSTSITTSSTSCACRWRTGRTRSSGRSPRPTRRSTSRCRARASSGSARMPASRGGAASTSWPASRCPRS